MPALSLRQCLELVAELGGDYLLTDNQGKEWTAAGVLASLTRNNPDHQSLSMYLRLADPRA